MPAKANLTKKENINIQVREIDFVSRFASNWEAFRNVLGLTRMIEKTPGATLRVVKAAWEPQNGAIGEGEEVPYSIARVYQEPIGEATFEKYGKAVSLEAISDYGFEDACARTDNAMLNVLQGDIMNRFFRFMLTGTNTSTESTFQMALAMARGKVINFFQAMQLDVTEVVGFVNTLDAYTYLGTADITIQTVFGMQYIENFMGYRVVFLLDSSKVPRGKVVALPVENMVAYYVDPAQSDFARAGLEFTVDGESPFLGFHIDGNYHTLVSENTAIMALYLFAEYLDGIAVITFGTSYTAGLTLNKATETVTVGSTKTLTATATPADAVVSWSSSDESKATVADGVVTGVAAGTATITAKIVVGGTAYTATCTVTVSAA